MTREEHKARHQMLHKALDELMADYLTHTGKLLSETTVMDFATWSASQIEFPCEKSGFGHKCEEGAIEMNPNAKVETVVNDEVVNTMPLEQAYKTIGTITHLDPVMIRIALNQDGIKFPGGLWRLAKEEKNDKAA